MRVSAESESAAREACDPIEAHGCDRLRLEGGRQQGVGSSHATGQLLHCTVARRGGGVERSVGHEEERRGRVPHLVHTEDAAAALWQRCLDGHDGRRIRLFGHDLVD